MLLEIISAVPVSLLVAGFGAGLLATLAGAAGYVRGVRRTGGVR